MLAKPRKLKKVGEESPVCFSHAEKLIEFLLIRQGVPVLKRPRVRPRDSRSLPKSDERIRHPTARLCLVAHMQGAAQKRARCDHDRTRHDSKSYVSFNSLHVIVLNNQSRDTHLL